MCRLYSEKLSNEEMRLGFIRAYVSNPDRRYHGSGSIVPAVILPIPHALRIIKLDTPSGGFTYPIQGFGDYGTGGPADWRPIRSGIDDPSLAIATADQGIEVPFNLGTPVIALRCPKCDHDFEVQAEYLPTDGQTKCPNCGHSEGTESFNAYNV